MVSIKKIDADLQFYYISSNIGVISHTHYLGPTLLCSSLRNWGFMISTVG